MPKGQAGPDPSACGCRGYRGVGHPSALRSALARSNRAISAATIDRLAQSTVAEACTCNAHSPKKPAGPCCFEFLILYLLHTTSIERQPAVSLHHRYNPSPRGSKYRTRLQDSLDSLRCG